MLTASFDKLPAASKVVHLVSFGMVAVSIILLVAPAAYHRIVAEGNAEERVLNYTARMMLPAVGLLAAGLVGDAYVTVRNISDMPDLAFAVAIAAAAGFASLLYVVPLLARNRRQRALAARRRA